MADRYFPNELPDYNSDAKTVEEESPSGKPKDSLAKLLRLPYPSLSERLKIAALDIKQKMVNETWGGRRKRVNDYTLYTGVLGTAFLLFKAYQVTNDKRDLALSSEIIKACDSAANESSRVTFICGRAGVCAVGAVVAKHIGDYRLCEYYLAEFKKIKLTNELPNELLYGRAGFLWACAFLNKNLGQETMTSIQMRAVIDEIINYGRQLATRGCPLMYEWHGKKYWGAAHGLAGIMHVLMDMDLKPDEIQDVKGTLHYMIKNRFPSGNYPSSEGSERDRLVHWCHGATGVALALAKASKVFDSNEFLQAAIEAGEVVWHRGLLKRVGLCHGISGNTYVFLSLHRLTGRPEYLHRAKAFASFLHDRAETLISEGTMHGGDRPYSLFEGIGGMAYLFLDMNEPYGARFPGYEL